MGDTTHNKCNICGVICNLSCSKCHKVNYCSKEHQRLDFENHKSDCFPAQLIWKESLGNHLVATRYIKPGECILLEKPLIVGPRSNLYEFQLICLECCALVSDDDGVKCTECHWWMCSRKCLLAKNSWHSKFECRILATNEINPPTTQNEFLLVTLLRCLLLRSLSPNVWIKLRNNFESHSSAHQESTRARELTKEAIHFIQNKCKLVEFDPATIEQVLGILLINGYSDFSKYFIKLYEFGSKLSHSCLPNTKSLLRHQEKKKTSLLNAPLQLISTVAIKESEILTQFYGTLPLVGTRRRLEFLTSIYHFTCSCARCIDPSELGTNFSGMYCRSPKCNGIVLPQNPIQLSTKWKCKKCGKKWRYEEISNPILAQICQMTQMDENQPLFSEFELYSDENPDEPLGIREAAHLKVDFVFEMNRIFHDLILNHVHPNHYSLLPVKTGLIATIYTLISQSELVPNEIRTKLYEIFNHLALNVSELFNVLCPGLTRNQGILSFYIGRGMMLEGKILDESGIRSVQEFDTKAQQILSMEPESDTFRQLMETTSLETASALKPALASLT